MKPDDNGIQVALADSLIVDQQYPEAEKIYRALVVKNKAFTPGYVQLYKLYIIQNRVADAENLLKQAVADNPKENAYLIWLAQYYYFAKRRDDMIRVLNQIKSRGKEFPDAYLTVGDFYYRLGDSEEAIRQYKEGMVADSKRKVNYQKREIEVLMRQGNRNMASEINKDILKADPKDNFARGLEAQLMLDKGEIQKAVVELQSVLSADPRNVVAHFNLGRAHYVRQEYEQARQQFMEAIRLRPDYVPARVELAKLYVTRNEYEAALKASAEILQIDRGNTNARIIQSAALLGLKKYSDSRELLQTMLQNDPNSTDSLFQLGVVDLAEGKFKDAEDAFQKDHSLEPSNPRGLMGLVEVNMAQGREDAAIQLLEGEEKKYPNRLDYHVALGNTAVRAGKYDLAIGEFQRVADSMDKNSKAGGDIYLRIGETFRRKGDLSGAINALQKARNLAPENIVIINTLALALDSAGQKQQAKMAYEQCLKLDPRNGVALNNLAYLLAENNGDLDQALTYAAARQTASTRPQRNLRYAGLDLPQEAAHRQRRRDFQGDCRKAAEPLHLPLPSGYGLRPEGRPPESNPGAERRLEKQSAERRGRQDQAVIDQAGMRPAILAATSLQFLAPCLRIRPAADSPAACSRATSSPRPTRSLRRSCGSPRSDSSADSR